MSLNNESLYRKWEKGMSGEGVISVSFTPGTDDVFLRSLFDSFSYDKRYGRGLSAALDAIDKPITGLRLTTVVTNLAKDKQSVGPVIDFLSKNKPARGMTYGAISAGAVANVLSEVCEQLDEVYEKDNRRDTTAHILAGLLPAKFDSATNNAKKIKSKLLDEKVAVDEVDVPVKFKNCLNNFIRNQINDAEYNEEFEDINLEVNKKNDKLKLNLKFKKKFYDKKKPPERGLLGNIKYYLQPLWDYIGEPLWTSGLFASFVYWAMFGLAFITTGNAMFDVPAGIAGIPEWLMFGLPFALAAPIVGLRAVNKYKEKQRFSILKNKIGDDDLENLNESQSRFSKKELEIEAMRVAAQVLEDASNAMEAELEMIVKLDALAKAEKNCARIRLALDENQPKDKITRRTVRFYFSDPSVQAANTFFTSSIANIGKVHYPAWIVNDLAILRSGKSLSGLLQSFLSTTLNVVCTVPLLDTVLGGVLLGIGLIFGIADMSLRYAAAQKAEKKAKELASGIRSEIKPGNLPISLGELEKKSLENTKTLDGLKKEIDDLYKLHRPKLCGFEIPDALRMEAQVTTWKENSLMRFWRKARKSVYLEAIDWAMIGIFFGRLLYPGGAAVFFPFILLAGGPWTIPVLFGLAALMIGLKYWEKVQIKKEEHLKTLPQQIEDSNISIELAKKKKEELELIVRLDNNIPLLEINPPELEQTPLEKVLKERFGKLFPKEQTSSEDHLIPQLSIGRSLA